jgi:hypothetical protein
MKTDENKSRLVFHLCSSVPHLWLIFSLLFCSVAIASEPVFTVTDKPAGPPLVGFGVEPNPYLYCTPNWKDVEPRVADFEAKVIALRPQHVRMFYRQEWFEGGEDNISKGDSRIVESFVRQCRLAQRAGATINVTPWRGPWPQPEKQMADFAAIIERLIREEKLTAIRYITIQNEPNTTPMTFEKYNRLYRALDAELKKRGLRDELKIISGDLVQNKQQEWFANLGKNLANISDGYSIHVYWDYWDTEKLVRRISEVPKIVAALPPAQQRPLYVTEFGIRGHREKPSMEPGNHDDGTPIANKPLQAMELAWFQMEAMNRGYVATIIWTLEDAWYDRLMPYGVIGAAKDGFPLKPGYHVLRLFTHTVPVGWQALKVEGAADGRIVAAARGPNRAFTVMALNQIEGPQRVVLNGLPRDRELHAIGWNDNDLGRLSFSGSMRLPTGQIVITLPPQGMAVFTTIDPKPLLEKEEYLK